MWSRRCARWTGSKSVSDRRAPLPPSGRRAALIRRRIETPTGPVTIVTCALEDDSDIALDLAIGWLAPKERARRDRFVRPADRDRFARGRGFVRRELARLIGCPPSEVPLLKGSNGKPYLKGLDGGFNLTHSGDLAVLAIAQKGAVGVDLELSSRRAWAPDRLAALARRCLVKHEVDALSAQPEGAARCRRFLQFWTAKEARMKIWGQGMSLKPKTIQLHLDTDGTPVGYAAPDGPVSLQFVALDRESAITCLALSTAVQEI